jgi:hypothetical protein
VLEAGEEVALDLWRVALLGLAAALGGAHAANYVGLRRGQLGLAAGEDVAELALQRGLDTQLLLDGVAPAALQVELQADLVQLAAEGGELFVAGAGGGVRLGVRGLQLRAALVELGGVLVAD